MPNLTIRNKSQILKSNYSDSLRVTLEAIEVGLKSVNPASLIKNSVKFEHDCLTISDYKGMSIEYDTRLTQSIYIIGAGKASAAMADSFIDIVKSRKVKEGCITVPYGIKMKSKLCSVTNAAHPIPDSNGVVGTKRIVGLLKKANKNDLVIMLLSGGASALMPLPLDIMSLADKQKITSRLLASGASIEEMNTVRKHISNIKGGRLAAMINKKFPLITLILSDVVEDKIDVIASGPTVPDITTFGDTKNVLIKYKLWNTQKVIPRKLKELINAGTLGKINDTPKPGDTIFTNIHNVIIGNNNIACNSIKLFLESKGIKTTYLGSKFTGSSRSLGEFLFKLVDDFPTVSTPYAFVLGGETTVELKNTTNGVGGRNQESVLSAASYFEEQVDNMDFTIASFGTDGIDGNSLDAGAILNPSVLSKIRKKRLKILNALKNHNSNVLFNKVNGALHTKITGTNVNDVCIVCRLR